MSAPSVSETTSLVVSETVLHFGHADHVVPYSVIALSGAVGIGALLRLAAREVSFIKKIPYTILVFLIGMAYGGLSTLSDDNILISGSALSDIDPHLILYIFLPILIFESAFSIDGHIFSKVYLHCLIMAGPGVIVASGLTAAIIKLVLSQYNWSWVTCLLMGAICSATDPVAVVALLKDLGCSPEISTLIEGESLFNDGTAIVIFSILRDAVPSGTLSDEWYEIVGELFRVTLGGSLLGLAIAIVTEFTLERVFNDPLIEVTLSVAVAYVTYFTAEGWFQTSGVLASVALGLYLSTHRQCFSPEVEHTLHDFWGILVFMANTIIFSLAGLIVAKKAFSDIKPEDIGYLALLYLAIIVVRGAVIVIFYQVMALEFVSKRYHLTVNQCWLVWWGGLRGAVGLALALVVENDADITRSNSTLGPHVIFFVSGIVILTLVVNGVSTGLLVDKLGLSVVSVERKKALKEAFELSISEQERAITELSSESVMAMTNWTKVRHLTIDKLHHPYPNISEFDGDAFSDGRSAYFKLFIAALWSQNSQGVLTPIGCRWLLGEVQQCRDSKFIRSQKHGKSSSLLRVDILEPIFDLRKLDKAQLMLLPPCGVKKAARSILETHRWTNAFEIATAYIHAHELVSKQISDFKLEQEIVNRIRDHCKQERTEGLQLLATHQRIRPEVAVAIKTRQAARMILNKGRIKIEAEIAAGRLDETDGKGLIDEIENQMERIRRMKKRKMPLPTAEEVLDSVRWASEDEEALHKVIMRSRQRNISKGDSLVTRSPEGSLSVSVLLSGVARINNMGSYSYYGPGFTAGLLTVLSTRGGKVKSRESVADTDGTVLTIDGADVLAIARQHPRMLNAMWQQAGEDSAVRVLSTVSPYIEWDHNDLKVFCKGGNVVSKTDNIIQLSRGCRYILLDGTVQSVEGMVYRSLCLLPSHLSGVHPDTNVQLFKIIDPTSKHNKAVKLWKLIASRISMIHTILCFLTEHDNLQYFKVPVLKKLVEGLFGKGRSLDLCMGGFGRPRGTSLLSYSPPGSPIGSIGRYVGFNNLSTDLDLMSETGSVAAKSAAGARKSWTRPPPLANGRGYSSGIELSQIGSLQEALLPSESVVDNLEKAALLLKSAADGIRTTSPQNVQQETLSQQEIRPSNNRNSSVVPNWLVPQITKEQPQDYMAITLPVSNDNATSHSRGSDSHYTEDAIPANGSTNKNGKDFVDYLFDQAPGEGFPPLPS